jgi:glycosyltransferase involved in cell wall biosynthesis
VVHTYHTLFETYVHHYVKSIPENLGRYLVHQGSRTFCNRHDHVITPSRAMAKVLRHYGVKVPISIIPTGINLVPFKKARGAHMRHQLGFSLRTPLLLNMGRVSGEKNIPFLLDVMEELRATPSKAKLVIAGEGPGLKSLKAECGRRNLNDRVLFVGYVTGQDWLDLLAAADLLLLASLTETQGLVLTEAMAAGTPCVAVGAMGVRDVMAQGGGIAVPPRVGAFTQAVIRLLADKKLYQIKKAEARRVARWNSVERRTRELLAVYQTVIAEKQIH